MTKVFGITVLVFGLMAVFATYNDIVPFWLENKPEEMRALWKQDLQILIQNQKLPKQWEEIKEVKYNPLTPSTAKFLKDIEPPLLSQKDGKYRLEVTLDDWKENNEYGLMIQYQLFDLQSQNMIWELGRTLLLNPNPTVAHAAEVGLASTKTAKEVAPPVSQSKSK
jgi:hypothetical protein